MIIGNRPLRRMLLLVLVIPALAACESEYFGRGIVVENQTDTPLTFEVVDDGERIPLPATLEPGGSRAILSGGDFGGPSRVTEGDCASGDVVALDPDGREVARHPPPLCVGDLWVIRSGD